MDNYKRFGIMLSISLVIMYTVMFLNMADIAHYHTSMTRIYMAILMVAPMTLVMMGMMKDMYKDKKKNTIIIASAVIIFILALAGLRMQVPIGDEQYMQAMIPHHSSAILTSRQADIQDPEVRELADTIIQAQLEEIAEMERLLEKLENQD